MPSQSDLERRKRSLSPPAKDDGRDRRRKYDDKRDDKFDNDRRHDYSGRTSSKRQNEDESVRSKYQRTSQGFSGRSRRGNEGEEDDDEEKPSRASRFVGERNPNDFRRPGSNSGRGFEMDSDNQRQSYRNCSDMPPSRRNEHYDRTGFDGGFRNAGAGGGYSRRGSSFGRWNSGRGRGAGGRGRTVVYRPGEDSQKPTMNLFDPSQVPKGRSYFEHEDRLSESNRRFRGRGRGRVSGGSRGAWQNRPRDYDGGRFTDVWQHDMFDDMETNDTAKNSADIAMDEGK